MIRPALYDAAIVDDATISAHRGLARAISRGYFLPGGDADDVEGEALVALVIAGRDYRPEVGIPFGAFAGIVIHRRLLDAVTAANRVKHRAMNERISPTVWTEDGELDRTDVLVDPRADTVEILDVRDRLARVRAAAATLTAVERAELGHILGGGSYAHDDGTRNKRRENAVQRARRKLRAAA